MPTLISQVYGDPLDDILETASRRFDYVLQAPSDFGEFDWFACDELGQIAMLTSFHHEGAPAAVFRSKEDYLAAYRCVHMLNKRGVGVPIDSATGKKDDWLCYSSVGLFGISSGGSRPPYWHEAQSRPSSAIRVSELSSEVQTYLFGLRFRNIDFSKVTEVSTRALGELLGEGSARSQ